MFSPFNKRVEPKYIKGLPEPVFFAAPTVLVLTVMAITVPVSRGKLAFVVGAIALLFYIWDTYRWYKNWLIRKSMVRGKERRKLPSWGAANKKTYLDGFTWETKIGDHGLIHQGGSVSVAIDWQGIQDRHWSLEERRNEHSRRVALLRTLSEERGLTVETHLVRMRDSRLTDAYLREGERMHGERPAPPIVQDIRQQLAETYRPLARSNKVLTVLSLAPPPRRGLWTLLRPQMGVRNRSAQDLYARLLELFKAVSPEFPGAGLLTCDEYQERIQAIRKPGAKASPVEWRFNLADQIVTEKPEFKDGCIFLDGRYYISCLLQGYPDLPYDWTLSFLEAPVDVHACQILMVKPVDEALNRDRKQADYESQTMDSHRGTDKAVAKIGESAAYRKYVVARNLSVADNAYIVTFSGAGADEVKHQVSRFRTNINKTNGLVRDNEDLQADLFDVRLPGMGRNTFFAREDHADVLAAMMPVTTFAEGNTAKPESLRITMSGQLVGFAPSTVEVPHELVVARTGSGKDTQFGLKFLETYPIIRYDIIEMGNSYQWAVEAVGGSYCRARDQVINPLAGYDEYQSAKRLKEQGHQHLDATFIHSQADMLQPIFKGMAGPKYTRSEEACVEKALRLLYEKPPGGEAPTLPMVLTALGDIEAATDGQDKARASLMSELKEFMETETGKAFTAEDQFTISPIANAIDFGGFTGELLQYYMTFMVVRLATNAMSRGVRSQIVLNEYKMLLQNAADPIRWITLTIDRMGRKEWVGLTRITQDLDEIQSVDPGSLSSIQNRTLLSRQDKHVEIGKLLDMPTSIVEAWQRFGLPDVMNRKGYREGLIQELDQWHLLYLKFPQLLLDLMNTRGEDKLLRERASRVTNDPYERIEILNKLKQERADNEKESQGSLI